LAGWTIAVIAISANVRQKRSFSVGVGAGFVSGLVGLVFFGTRLGQPADAAGVSAGLVPQAWLLALGFVGLGVAVGLVGGAIGRVIARSHTQDLPAAHWLSRFALVACVAIAPLIFIGGLVTSTNFGMSVPDWPQTYGANMFLYPLGSHTDPGKFVEHTHRLFGAFAGLTVFTLAIWVFAVDRRRGVRILAVIAFVLVCVQGLLGGGRVHFQTALAGSDPLAAERIGRWLALLHGVLAQLTFALVVALTVVLSDHFRALTPGQVLLDAARAKRVRVFCTAAMHSLILQLILGAIYRHFRGGHALLSHIGWSVVATTLAILAGFTLTSEPVQRTLVGRRASVIGLSFAVAGLLQFLLGWLAFAFAGHRPDAISLTEALIRTSHQANGAVLLALATAAFVWARRLARGSKSISSATA
jgi:hypothetical protein